MDADFNVNHCRSLYECAILNWKRSRIPVSIRQYVGRQQITAHARTSALWSRRCRLSIVRCWQLDDSDIFFVQYNVDIAAIATKMTNEIR